MTVTGRYPIINRDFTPAARARRSWTKIEFQRFPSIASLSMQAEAGRWLITAVRHAILTPGIARDPIHQAIFFPRHGGEHFAIGFVMTSRPDRVRHEIAGRLPAH